MAVEAPEITQAVAQAREVISNYPRTGNAALHLEAINELVGMVTGLDVRIPPPPSVGYAVLDTALKKSIPHLPLVYLPEHDSRMRYPSMITHRLSTEGWQTLHNQSLGVEPGWRIMDLRKIDLDRLRQPKGPVILIYQDDANFLGPLIAEIRSTRALYRPEDLDIEGVTQESRTCLVPVEIQHFVSGRVDELVGLPRGIMKLPTVREAMIAAAIYDPDLLEYREWQTAELSPTFKTSAIISTLHPAGLTNTHDSDDGKVSYYDIVLRSKHKHRPDIGFRLMGKLT